MPTIRKPEWLAFQDGPHGWARLCSGSLHSPSIRLAQPRFLLTEEVLTDGLQAMPRQEICNRIRQVANQIAEILHVQLCLEDGYGLGSDFFVLEGPLQHFRRLLALLEREGFTRVPVNEAPFEDGSFSYWPSNQHGLSRFCVTTGEVHWLEILENTLEQGGGLDSEE
jgi:hypothetical protein